jgi:outer membrane biosynthesis protein TonB
VAFTVEVTPDGGVSSFKILSGHPLLQKQVEASVADWRFPAEAVGQEIRATIEFKMNCPSK